MQDLTPQQKNRLLKLAKVVDKGNLAIAEYLFELEDKMNEEIPSIKDVISRVKGDKGDTPTDSRLLALIRPLIPQVKDGKTPTLTELMSLIKPLIPKVENGKTPTRSDLLALIRPLIPKVENGAPGKTHSEQELLALITPLIPKLESVKPDMPNQVIAKINIATDKIKMSAVEGLSDLERISKMNAFNPTMGPSFSDLRDINQRISSLSTGTAASVAVEVPSGSVNSSNVTFTVSYVPLWITVNGLTFYENFGYTRTDGTLTLDDAPTTGSIVRSVNQGVAVAVTPVETFYLLTEDGNNFITEDGNNLILE